jgi:anti-anti-sigma factor
MVRAHEWDGSRRLGRVPASRQPWWVGHPAAHSTAAAPLRFGWESAGAHAVLAVDGDLDARTAAQLEAVVTASPLTGCAVLDLDLAGVRSLGSAGLSGLLELHRWCGQRGIELRVRGALPSIDRVFEVAGLDSSFAPTRGGTPPPSGDQDLALF